MAQEVAAVWSLADTLGLGAVAPALLKAAHHTSLLLHPLPMVARVQSVEPVAQALVTAERELAISRHLTARDMPVVPPLKAAVAGPHVIDGCVISLWPFIEHSKLRRQSDMVLAAHGLRSIHNALRDFSGTLPSYDAILDRCWTVLETLPVTAFPMEEDKNFLQERYLALREQATAMDVPSAVLHGDAHKGNVLISNQGPVLWADFESACTGPLEFELVTLPRYARRCFGKHDQRLIDIFTDLKSVCVAVWCLADGGRSAEIRDAAGYHLGRLKHSASNRIGR
ncbi:aminoglycoside phosphotransferase family protein [Azospirillum sp. B4]|uniref:phosphotransferase n=1 Tax=Azospirillum sp. B4 TaxID=95605 RepID=UPI000347175C|nr:aminoglycoside phosphotransferase family protein [Azospirillum sp. B4]